MESHGYIGTSPKDPKSNMPCTYYYYTNMAGTYAQFMATLENPSVSDLATMNGSLCNNGNYRVMVSP